MRKISAALLIYLGLASAALAQGIIPCHDWFGFIATGPISQLKIVSPVSAGSRSAEWNLVSPGGHG